MAIWLIKACIPKLHSAVFCFRIKGEIVAAPATLVLPEKEKRERELERERLCVREREKESSFLAPPPPSLQPTGR